MTLEEVGEDRKNSPKSTPSLAIEYERKNAGGELVSVVEQDQI
jgi:hypothetical protein